MIPLSAHLPPCPGWQPVRIPAATGPPAWHRDPIPGAGPPPGGRGPVHRAPGGLRLAGPLQPLAPAPPRHAAAGTRYQLLAACCTCSVGSCCGAPVLYQCCTGSVLPLAPAQPQHTAASARQVPSAYQLLAVACQWAAARGVPKKCRRCLGPGVVHCMHHKPWLLTNSLGSSLVPHSAHLGGRACGALRSSFHTHGLRSV